MMFMGLPSHIIVPRFNSCTYQHAAHTNRVETTTNSSPSDGCQSPSGHELRLVYALSVETRKGSIPVVSTVSFCLRRQLYARMATTDTCAATTATQEDLMKLTNDYQFTDADIVIRASGMDFFVHTFILANASPVFKDMLSLPSDGPSQKAADGCDIAIVALDEDALTLHRVLCLYYPHAQDPRDFDLRSLHSSLLALRKYDMEKGRIHMARELLAHVISASIQAFAVACNAGLKETAHFAARRSLRQTTTMATATTTISYNLPLPTFQKLIQYRLQCGEAALSAVTNLGWLSVTTDMKEWCWLSCTFPQCASAPSYVTIRRHNGTISPLQSVLPKNGGWTTKTLWGIDLGFSLWVSI